MTLLQYVRDHLIANNVVRKPSVGGAKPPLWLQPRDGVPAPGEKAAPEDDDAIVIGAFLTQGIAREPYTASALRTDGIDFRFRVARADLVDAVDDAIRAVLNDQRNYSLAGLPVVESMLFRPLAFLGSDENGFDFVSEYHFERYA